MYMALVGCLMSKVCGSEWYHFRVGVYLYIVRLNKKCMATGKVLLLRLKGFV
jgi:hypothetical protein